LQSDAGDGRVNLKVLSNSAPRVISLSNDGNQRFAQGALQVYAFAQWPYLVPNIVITGYSIRCLQRSPPLWWAAVRSHGQKHWLKPVPSRVTVSIVLLPFESDQHHGIDTRGAGISTPKWVSNCLRSPAGEDTHRSAPRAGSDGPCAKLGLVAWRRLHNNAAKRLPSQL